MQGLPVVRELKRLAHLYDEVVTSGRFKVLSVHALRLAILEVKLGGHGFPFGQYRGAAVPPCLCSMPPRRCKTCL